LDRKPLLIYDDIFLSHEMPSLHPESADRLISCIKVLEGSDLSTMLDRRVPRMALPEEIEAVHDASYVAMTGSIGSGYLDPDTYMSPGTYKAALYAAGAVMTAVDAYFEEGADRGFCLVRPPGHHAEMSRGMGFCIFNNVAVGARYARNKGIERIMIADFDVHHGNGTQNIFYEDPSVFYFSTHQSPHYPGTGRASEKGRGDGDGYTCNIPLPAGSGDKELVRVYEEVFREKAALFDPSMILVSAGYDLHGNDPLAGFQVSDEGVARIVGALLAAGRDIPVFFSLEGGYDLSALSRCVITTLEILCRT